MTSVTMSGVTIDGADVRCPEREGAAPVRRLTFMASGTAVHATCGERHRSRNGGSRAQCFFPVENLTAAALGAISKAKPGRVRVTLPGGRRLEGKLISTAASSSSTGKAAAAIAAKGGKAAAPGPAKPAGRATGGSFAAAMNAVAAVAGAAGQTVAAVGQVATAGASAVSSVSSVAREGIGAGRDGIKAADQRGKRRHEREMRESGD